MAFNFGGAPTPGPAPAGGGFNFSSTTPAAGQPSAPAANAPATFAFGAAPAQGAPAAPQVPAAPATSFSFGGSQPAPATANTPAAPTFGAAPTTTNTPAPPTFGAAPTTTNTPAAPTFGAAPANAPATTTAPAPGGAPAPSFAFGSTAANTPAPGSIGAPPPTTAPTPATIPATGGISFGGASAATAPSAAGGFSLSGSTPAPSAALTVAAPEAPRGLQVPDFHELFPNESIYSDMRRLLARGAKDSEEGRESALELVYRLQCDGTNEKAVGKLLCAPKPLEYKPPDPNLRNQLHANPTVVLSGNREATLMPQMLQEVCRIADDLRISEKEALVLYAEVSKQATRTMLEQQLMESIVDKALFDNALSVPQLTLGNDVVKAAKELYFFERQRSLETILMLVQSRIDAPYKPWGNLIIEATDSLLQNKLIDNLINLIREWTVIIGGIEKALARDQPQSYITLTKEKRKKHFDLVHLTFAMQARQTAAEALFYLAYHTQFTALEIASLIDVVKDLSNGMNGDKGLVPLDPFRDVPSSFEDLQQPDHPWATYPTHVAPKKRKLLEWERLLVKRTLETGMPELLRCVSTLIVTVIAAMDTKQVLIDRNTHRANVFGKGNKLCPPGESSTSGLEPIHSRFDHSKVKDWERTDICGLFIGAFALLLSTTPPLLSSPRAGGSSPSRTLVTTFGNFVTAPMALKSITFARACLLPALHRPTRHPETMCDSSEFLLSVLGDFVATFVDVLSNTGNLPGSQDTWYKEQEQDLALQRDQREQQKQFRLWSGSYQEGTGEKPIPDSVDKMNRPDCMDDIITLAVSVASLGPEFAIKFWSTASELDDQGKAKVSLVQSRFLKKTKGIISEDATLSSFYYAFLAALSTAKCTSVSGGGAEVVHSILSDPTETHRNWGEVLATLRWYFQQLDKSRASPAATNSSLGSQSASNYYLNLSLASNRSNDAAKSLEKPKPVVLGERNVFYLLALLGVLDKSSSLPSTRLEILSKTTPIYAENSSEMVGTDTTLNILFSLFCSPITPDIRGAISSTLASLLSTQGMEASSDEDKTKMREFCSTAWELVETCQIVPVILLDQYPQMTGEVKSGLSFPASSTSLAGIGGTSDSMIPVDQRYAILFEMEHVESHEGVYSSTEGFLRLLNSLFSCCCPTTLGRQWRLRTGCSPYIEYVIHYVLPRATGSASNTGKLPFRTKADEARLVALALQLVESVLIRYTFTNDTLQQGLRPSQQPKIGPTPTSTEAGRRLGHPLLAERVVEPDASSSTGYGRDDFENKTVSLGQVGQTGSGFGGIGLPGQIFAQQQPTFEKSTASSIPSPKSPGFVVLANILSATDGEIMRGVAKVLAGNVAVSSALGSESSDFAEVFALFRDTPPTTESAAHAGRNDVITPKMRSDLMAGLKPAFEASSSYAVSVDWHERSVIHALQILCATAVREEAFITACNSSKHPLKIVPVAKFDKMRGLAAINMQNVHLSSLPELLMASRGLVASVVDSVGHISSTDDNDASVAMSGVSLIYFIQQSLPSHTKIERVFGSRSSESKRLSAAIARRLSCSFERSDSTPDSLILSLLLRWILSDLRREKKAGLANTLFGVSEIDSGKQLNQIGRSKDCFGSILEMLNDHSFILDTATSGFAASCFEILARFCDLQDVNDPDAFRRVDYFMERLRSSYFWRAKLDFFFRSVGQGEMTKLQSAVATGNSDLIHCMAWVLKGVACEIHMLSGFSPTAGDLNSIVGYIAPRLGEYNTLLSFLFGASGEGLANVIDHLPIERLAVNNSSNMPSQDAIRVAMKNLDGPVEVTSGYKVVDEALLLKTVSPKYNNEQVEEFKAWSISWNKAVRLDCAATHLSDMLRMTCCASLAGSNSERAIPGDALASLLALILDRLVGLPRTSQMSPTATLNLSMVVLVLSQHIVYPGGERRPGAADLRIIRDLLARCVVISGEKLPGGITEIRARERTAILSCSLVEVMQAIPGDETEIDHNLFLQVAHTLARLSASAIHGNNEATLIARSTLTSLVGVWDQGIQAANESLGYTLITQVPDGESQTNAKMLLRLLSSLDVGVVVLVEELLHVPFVGEALLQQGLMDALLMAAKNYMKEEERLQLSWSQANTTRKVLGFPSCLHQHLRLFRVLMATSKNISEDQVKDLPMKFSDMLTVYRGVLQRTCSNFPAFGKELLLLVQCFAQVSMLLTDTTKSGLHSGIPLQSMTDGRVSFRDSEMEKMVLHITLNVAENPVPKEWLANLPHSLRQQEKSDTSRVVSFSEATGCSWWVLDRLQVERRKYLACNFEEFSEEMFAHALLGADILEAGLTVLMNLAPQSFDIELSLVRGLFLLSKAAQSVMAAVELLFVAPEIDFMETDAAKVPAKKRLVHLRQFGRRLHTCVERLMMLLVHRVRMLIQEPENRLTLSVERYCRSVAETLDHTELEGRGAPCSLGKDEEDRTKLLASTLRNHIQGVRL